jgi:hypothetical protein
MISSYLDAGYLIRRLPIREHAFLSGRNSSACSAITSFSSWASHCSSLTSSVVAALAVSPESRRLPASRAIGPYG